MTEEEKTANEDKIQDKKDNTKKESPKSEAINKKEESKKIESDNTEEKKDIEEFKKNDEKSSEKLDKKNSDESKAKENFVLSSSERENISTEDNTESYGQIFLHFFKRTDYNINQNLRFLSVILAIILLFGMFQPLMGIKYGVQIKTSNQDTEKSKSISIIPVNTQYFNLNIGDLVVHQSLKDFEVLGTPIGNITLFGINLYNFLSNSNADIAGLEKPNNTLDEELIRFLKSEQFVTICNNFLGENAQAVIDVANTIVDMSQNTDDAKDKAEEIQSKLVEAKSNLAEAIHSIEGLVSIIETVVFLIVALFIAGVILLCFKKLPRYLAPAIMTPVCVLFLGIGVGFIVANSIIGSMMGSLDQTFNQVLQDLLTNSLPDAAKMLEGILGSVNINFVLTFEIVAGLGWWIMTLCITGCTVFGYIIGRRNKGLVGSARN